MTLLNRLKTGAIASDESRHESWIQGSEIPGILDPFGSIITANFATPSE